MKFVFIQIKPEINSNESKNKDFVLCSQRYVSHKVKLKKIIKKK
jgi:hypothetical protein